MFAETFFQNSRPVQGNKRSSFFSEHRVLWLPSL